MAPCLRVVTYSGTTREQKNHEFMHRHYMELAISEFDTIHMYLMNEMGELAPFEFGNLTITLNFREKNDETPSSIWKDFRMGECTLAEFVDKEGLGLAAFLEP